MRFSRITLSYSLFFIAQLLLACGARAQCSSNLGLGSLNVAAISGRPFQAEWVSEWTGTPVLPATSPLWRRSVALVARDSQGRVRIERSAGTYNVRNGNEAGAEVQAHSIAICGGPSKQRIILDTLNKTARISPQLQRPLIASGEASSTPFCRFADAFMRSSRFRIEELGQRTIEGFDASGFKISMLPLGAEDTGTVRSVRELWCSEELGAVLLEVQPMQREMKHETSMTKVERREPDASLFDIPPDYTIEELVNDGRRSPQAGQLGPAAVPPKP